MICNICANQTCTHHGYCHWPGCSCWCGCGPHFWWWFRKHFTRWNLNRETIRKLIADGYDRVLYSMDDVPAIYIPSMPSIKKYWRDHNAE